MSAFTNGLSELVNRVTGGNSGTPEHLFLWKDTRVSSAACAATTIGRWTSAWQYEGFPSHGAAPGAVAVPDETTAGGLRQTDPGGGRQKWMVGGGLTVLSGGTFVLYDRLLHISGLDGTSVAAQTVGGSLTRYTNGLGNQIWAEIYTQIGATARTITASYTDQSAGASTSPAVAFGGTGLREAQRIVPLTLAADDYGVQGVTSVTINVSTGTAGDFGINIVHPLAYYTCRTTGYGSERNLVSQQMGPIEILPNACLALAYFPQLVSPSRISGTFVFVES